MLQSVNIYTEDEREFLSNLLDLLEVHYTVKDVPTNEKELAHIKFIFKADLDEMRAISSCMKLNYNRLTGRQ